MRTTTVFATHHLILILEEVIVQSLEYCRADLAGDLVAVPGPGHGHVGEGISPARLAGEGAGLLSPDRDKVSEAEKKEDIQNTIHFLHSFSV